jgi:hypothetical protein
MQAPDEFHLVAGIGLGKRALRPRPHRRALDAVHARSLTGRPGHGHPEDGKHIAAGQIPKRRRCGKPTTKEHLVVRSGLG